MKITFDELRQIKHSLPSGSIRKIAEELQLEEQTVRNYFGGDHYETDTNIAGLHIESGPNGSIVSLSDTRIIEAAKRILAAETVE